MFNSLKLLFIFLLHVLVVLFIFFFFHDAATTEIYTLSLHDALPISWLIPFATHGSSLTLEPPSPVASRRSHGDRKSTRLNSSHAWTSYADFCSKKKEVQDAVPGRQRSLHRGPGHRSPPSDL